jgi:hypothetical protein
MSAAPMSAISETTRPKPGCPLVSVGVAVGVGVGSLGTLICAPSSTISLSALNYGASSAPSLLTKS